MRAFACVLVALLLAAGVDARDRRCRPSRDGQRTSDCGSVAFFEFAPESGAGLGTECACSAVTGAKGEALTYTRTGTAACTIGHTTTGIDNGDVVLCAANQPRVMRGGDGTGPLGLLVESARTNLALRSEEFDNAAWTAVGTPGETPNTTVSPWGTMTGDTIEDNDGAAYEGEQQTLATTAGQPSVLSVYAKAGTLDKVRLSNDGTVCDFDSLSSSQWTRLACADTSASGASTVQQILLGTGASPSDTGTVHLAGAQFETGAGVSWASSYIPTTSAAVARGADSASTTLPVALSTAAGASWASTTTHPSANGGSVWAAAAGLVADASNRTQTYRANTNTAPCSYLSASGSLTAGGATAVTPFVAGQTYRQACSYSGPGASSTVSNYLGGTLVNTTAPGTTSAFSVTTVCPGALGAACTTAPADAVVSRVCVDPSPTRCR